MNQRCHKQLRSLNRLIWLREPHIFARGGCTDSEVGTEMVNRGAPHIQLSR
jgi:hypothetical protein